MTIFSRTRSTSNGSSSARTMVSVSAAPTGPRIWSTASSIVRPTIESPSMAVM